MAVKLMLPNQLLRKVSSLLVPALVVVASSSSVVAQENSSSSEFFYGCGTGCIVYAHRISEIDTIQITDGNSEFVVNTALFGVEQIRGNDTANPVVAYTGTTRMFASCSTLRVGANVDGSLVPNPDWWVQLSGTQSDYSTASQGRGFYFDELCR